MFGKWNNFQTSCSFSELHVWTASKSSSTSLLSKVKISLSTGWPKHNCNPEIKLQFYSYVKKIIITSKQWWCLAWILIIVSPHGTSFSMGFIKFNFILSFFLIPQSSIFVSKWRTQIIEEWTHKCIIITRNTEADLVLCNAEVFMKLYNYYKLTQSQSR
jgi:hypothetical protein